MDIDAGKVILGIGLGLFIFSIGMATFEFLYNKIKSSNNRKILDDPVDPVDIDNPPPGISIREWRMVK
jgi:hypothetical protein